MKIREHLSVSCTLVATFAIGLINVPVTLSAKSDAETEFQFTTDAMSVRVDGLNYGEAVSKLGERTPEYYEWFERWQLTYRRLGGELWQQQPTLPERALWLKNTLENAPQYWRDVPQSARARAMGKQPADLAAQVDVAAQIDWQRQYMVLRADCMADPKVLPELKELIRSLDLEQFISNYGHRYSREQLEALHVFCATNALWDFYEHYRDGPAVRSARALLDTAKGDRGTQRAFLTALSLHPHPDLSWFAKGELSLEALREKPLEVHLETLAGEPFDLASRHGKVVLLDLWSNGCLGCIEMMPFIQALQNRYGSYGFEVVGIWFAHSAKESTLAKEQALGRGFLSKQGARYSNAFMPAKEGEEFMNRYGLTGFPVTWLLDRTGRLAEEAGYGDDLENSVRRVLGLAALKPGEPTVRSGLAASTADHSNEMRNLYEEGHRNREERQGDVNSKPEGHP